MMNIRHLNNKNIKRFILPAILALFVPQTALAEDDCTDAKQLVKGLKAFYGADASLKDVVDPVLKFSMQSVDETMEFSGLLYRDEEIEHRFDIDENGDVLGLEASVDKVSPKGELCILVDGNTIEDREESIALATASFIFPYKNTTGSLSMDELLEGAKDSSKVMKSLAPSGLGFFVPKMKSIVIMPVDDNEDLPVLTLMKKGEIVDVPEPVMLNSGQYYHLSDLKKTKADTFMISGNYALHANFDFKDEELIKAEAQRLEALANPDASTETDALTPPAE
ncbi:MAG: hypothetical protein ABJG88_00540 [Litorimonas sp.]